MPTQGHREYQAYLRSSIPARSLSSIEDMERLMEIEHERAIAEMLRRHLGKIYMDTAFKMPSKHKGIKLKDFNEEF